MLKNLSNGIKTAQNALGVNGDEPVSTINES